MHSTNHHYFGVWLRTLSAALLCLYYFCSSAVAASSVAASAIDAGGRRATSSAYTMDVSLGGIGGISTANTPTAIAKLGYVGQLFEVRSITVTVAPSFISESSTGQLHATATIDDATALVVAGSNVVWATPTFPVATVSSSGLLTPSAVYTDTVGTVSGYYLGASNVISFLVINTDPDNFGAYAHDSIPDDWQIRYFGINNPLGLSGVDADGTGQNNLIKYLAGLDPTNNSSVFRITNVARSGYDTRITWTCVGGYSYVLQSTRTAAINGYSTNFTDASPVIAVAGTGESTTNFLDVGVLVTPVLSSPILQNNSSGTPATVDFSADGSRGLADSLGQPIATGSLLLLGTVSIDEPTIRSNFYAGNLNAIMSAFTPYTNSFAVGDGTGLPASWNVSLNSPGLSGQTLYLVAVDKPVLSQATHLGVFTAPSWVIPGAGDEIAIDLEDATDFVIGAHGGALTITLGLGAPYTFLDTARLSYLPGRNLHYRVRLAP